MVEGETGRGLLFVCLFLFFLLLSFVCLFLRGVNKCEIAFFVFKLSQFQSMVYGFQRLFVETSDVQKSHMLA